MRLTYFSDTLLLPPGELPVPERMRFSGESKSIASEEGREMRRQAGFQAGQGRGQEEGRGESEPRRKLGSAANMVPRAQRLRKGPVGRHKGGPSLKAVHVPSAV